MKETKEAKIDKREKDLEALSFFRLQIMQAQIQIALKTDKIVGNSSQRALLRENMIAELMSIKSDKNEK